MNDVPVAGAIGGIAVTGNCAAGAMRSSSRSTFSARAGLDLRVRDLVDWVKRWRTTATVKSDSLTRLKLQNAVWGEIRGNKTPRVEPRVSARPKDGSGGR